MTNENTTDTIRLAVATVIAAGLAINCDDTSEAGLERLKVAALAEADKLISACTPTA